MSLKQMKIVFCNNFLAPNRPDEDFEAEYEAAVRAGHEVHLISLESLREGNPARFLRSIPVQQGDAVAMYRGWMLLGEEYAALYQGLRQRKLQLINTPDEYLNCHYFPNSYPKIKVYTPQSTWLEVAGEVDFGEIAEKLKVFGDRPVVLKDYVKSEKHYWAQACFIPSAASRTDVERVTNAFLALRGQYLNKGLVYRAFVELEPLTKHSSSKMPLSKEFRLFYLDKKLLVCAPYWNEGAYDAELPDLDTFNEVATRIDSNFFTMDVAKQKNGEWLIIELGDGQVSGLPAHLSPDAFYESLRNKNC